VNTGRSTPFQLCNRFSVISRNGTPEPYRLENVVLVHEQGGRAIPHSACDFTGSSVYHAYPLITRSG